MVIVGMVMDSASNHGCGVGLLKYYCGSGICSAVWFSSTANEPVLCYINTCLVCQWRAVEYILLTVLFTLEEPRDQLRPSWVGGLLFLHGLK